MFSMFLNLAHIKIEKLQHAILFKTTLIFVALNYSWKRKRKRQLLKKHAQILSSSSFSEQLSMKFNTEKKTTTKTNNPLAT